MRQLRDFRLKVGQEIGSAVFLVAEAIMPARVDVDQSGQFSKCLWIGLVTLADPIEDVLLLSSSRLRQFSYPLARW